MPTTTRGTLLPAEVIGTVAILTISTNFQIEDAGSAMMSKKLAYDSGIFLQRQGSICF
jgi:hypothetical protein